jgi:hypothetical protein
VTLVAAAVVPTPPLLVPEVAGGSAHLDDDLRAACDAAVAELLEVDCDRVVVVGAADATGPLEGSWDWRGFGVASPPEPVARRLPLGPAVGVWLLDRCGTGVVPEVVGVGRELAPDACAALGAQLVAGPGRVGLLVCGDGSACRDVKAPGHLDPRAEAFDEACTAALTTGDVEALLGLDRALARELLAAGPPAWQVLAGAARGGASYDCRVLHQGAPYGVHYVVAGWCLRP